MVKKLNCLDNLIYITTVLDFDIKGHTILFEDKKSAIHQVKFDGIPFIVNSMQESDCVHGKDWNLSKKEKERKQKSMLRVA